LLVLLSDDPQSASWLSARESQKLTEDLQRQDLARRSIPSRNFGEVLRHPIPWVFGSIYFCVQCGVYAINFWLPTILKSASGLSNGLVGALSAVPYLAATIFMLAMGHSADARREYRWHLAGPMLLGALGLGFCIVSSGSLAWSLTGLTLGAMGTITALPLFWPSCIQRLNASSAAAGIALINSLGQVAGFVSPYLVGWLKEYSGSTGPALLMLTVLLGAGACLVLSLPRRIEAIALARS
jgi:predicted MFS family arabinose efflux permease